MPLDGRFDTLLELDSNFHERKTLATLELPPEDCGRRRIGIAVIGVGRMGAVHLDNVVREPRANLLYIFDADKTRLEVARKKYYLDERGVKVLSLDGWETILQDKRVEVLFISTPTFTHEKYVREGLESGKHVLCEKPLAENAESVKRLVDLSQAKKLKLICAFTRRYDPTFRRLKHQLTRGDIGQLRIIKTCQRDSPMPPVSYIKNSGGIFHDSFIHDIDVTLWMAQELPVEVNALASCYDPGYKECNDFDTILVTMKYASGLISCTDLSRLNVTGYDQRIELFGTKGMLKIDEVSKLDSELHTEYGVLKQNNHWSFSSRFQEAYANEITEMFNHIEGNKTFLPLNPTYLNHLCKVASACEKSAKSGQPVQLSWSEEDRKGPL